MTTRAQREQAEDVADEIIYRELFSRYEAGKHDDVLNIAIRLLHLIDGEHLVTEFAEEDESVPGFSLFGET